MERSRKKSDGPCEIPTFPPVYSILTTFCPRLPSFLFHPLYLYLQLSQVHQMEKIVEMGAPSEDRLLDKM